MNKLLIASLSGMALSMPLSAHAGFLDFLRDLFTSSAGSKSVDTEEGKDVSKFLKSNQCPKLYPWGEPKVKNAEVNKKSLFICRTNYAVQYDTVSKNPLWVTEFLNKKNFEIRPLAQPNEFQPDKDVPSKMQAKLADFQNTWYDMGQMAPAADMVLNKTELREETLVKLNKAAMQESFYLTNVSPQVAVNMSKGIWADLESQVRIWTVQKGRLFVTTGPIFLNGQNKGVIGASKVAVPTHFFKIITEPIHYGSVAYIIPNQEVVTANTKKVYNPKEAFYCNGQACTLDNFVVSIQEVERLSGIDFYTKLAPHYAARVKQDASEFMKQKIREEEKVRK